MANGIFEGGFAKGMGLADRSIEASRRTGIAEQEQTRREDVTLDARRQNAIANTAGIALQAAEKLRERRMPVPPQLVQDFRAELEELGAPPSQIEGFVQQMTVPPAAQLPEIVNIRNAEGKSVSMTRNPDTGELSPIDVPGQAPAPEAPATDENMLFGVPVPPVIADINALKAPVQKELFKSQNKATTTAQLLVELELFKGLVETAQTGRITEITLPMVQFFRQAGINLKEDVPALEALQAAQNQLALRLRNPDSGFGLTGNTSDRDVKFLKDAVGGLQNTPEGNRAAIIAQIGKMRRDADLAALKAQLFERGSPQLFSKVREAFVEQTPLFTPEEETFLNSLKGDQTGFTDIGGGVKIRPIP